MRFLYLAVHYPKPEHLQDLLEGMEVLAAAMREVPGLLEATAWRETDGSRVIAMSTWAAEESFRLAVPVIQAALKDVPFSEWERRPRELARMNELPRGR